MRPDQHVHGIDLEQVTAPQHLAQVPRAGPGGAGLGEALGGEGDAAGLRERETGTRGRHGGRASATGAGRASPVAEAFTSFGPALRRGAFEHRTQKWNRTLGIHPMLFL